MLGKNFKKEPTERQKVGELGENSACKYLERNGFTILDRNYLKKWGELDIVAKRGSVIHFVEVKSKTGDLSNVTHETVIFESEYRPEDNMHKRKLERLSRAVESYLLDENVSDETDWQFDLAVVVIDQSKRLSHVSMIEDIVIG